MGEQHVIYSVSKEDFESCRVSNSRPKIVAICNKPDSFMYFTITFRSFSPTPGGMEFKAGQDYYFISTSTKRDLHPQHEDGVQGGGEGGGPGQQRGPGAGEPPEKGGD